MQPLEDYEISPVTGCLLREPVTPPPTLVPYKRLLEYSYKLLKTGEARQKIRELPPLDTSQLKTLDEKRLAHKILAFLCSQYVWQDGDENPVEILPANIAMPLMEVSIELGCQPLLGHIDLVLSNCFPEKTELGQRQSFNIEFFPSDEDNWVSFIERTADIELTFADGAKIIMHIISAIKRKNIEAVMDCLIKLGDIISIMREQMLLLLKELDDKAFYVDMRPYLSGWSHGKVSQGLVYEGVPDSVLTGAEADVKRGGTIPQKRGYLGASAGQSVTLQSLDALFGVEHYDDTNKFFVNVRQYMIREHRKFVEDLHEHTHLRTFVANSGSDELKKIYNGCVGELILFRKDHVQIVEKFIIDAAKSFTPCVDSLKNQGTGGTDLDRFLSRVFEKTKAALFAV